jgi:hypothetical protein
LTKGSGYVQSIVPNNSTLNQPNSLEKVEPNKDESSSDKDKQSKLGEYP